MPVVFLFVLTQVMNLLYATDTTKLKGRNKEEISSIDFMMENVIQHFKNQNRKLSQFKKKHLAPSVAQFIGNYLDPPSAQKMAMTDTQWSKMKVYEMLIPNQCPAVKFFQHLETGIVVYDDPFIGLPRKTIGLAKAKLDEILKNPEPRGNSLLQWLRDYGNLRFHRLRSFQDLTLFTEKLVYLIAEDVDINMSNRYPAPLMLAIRFSADEAIRKLLERGADVSGGANVGEQSALHLAVAKECESSCEILLQFNADINAEDRWGDTPLNFAVSRNLPYIVKLLLDESTGTKMSTIDKALSVINYYQEMGGRNKYLACANIITEYKNKAQKRKRKQKSENQE